MSLRLEEDFTATTEVSTIVGTMSEHEQKQPSSSLHAVSSNYLDNLPYLVIEEIQPGYRVSPQFIKTDNMPLAPSRIRLIKRVHAIRFSYSGCYLGRNFGKYPHYTVDQHRFDKDIRSRCDDHGIPIKMYPSDKFVTVSDVIVVFNLGIPENNIDGKCKNQDANGSDMAVLRTVLDKLNFPQIISDIKDNPPQKGQKAHSPDRIRGAQQSHFGYGSNYSLTRMDESHGGYVCPRLLQGTNCVDWSNRFSVMTRLGDIMYHHPVSKGLAGKPNCGLFDAPVRTAKFAARIHADSKIEAITSSTTHYPGCHLAIHLDVNNDDTPTGERCNYNYVVCAWQCDTQDDGSVLRHAILGYSRRSVGDFLRRSEACSVYLDQVIRPWISSLPKWRTALHPNAGVFFREYFMGQETIDEFGAIVFPPSFNKQATYLSAFADSFLSFKKAYEEINSKKMTVEKQLECILPVAFCNNAQQYVRVFDDWAKDRNTLSTCISENITHLFVSHSNAHWGSIRTGGHPRHQPTFNADPTPTWIFFALRCVRSVLIKSLDKQGYSYRCMVSDLKAIKHFGDLTSQHIVHILCLVNLLPPQYGMEATICIGTKTAMKLHTKYGINKSSFPCLLEYVSAEMNYSKSISENVICKSTQTKDSRFRDCIMPNQVTVSWIGLHNGTPKLHVVSKIQRGDHKADLNRVTRVTFNKRLPFEDLGIDAPPVPIGDMSQGVIHKWYGVFSKRQLEEWSNKNPSLRSANKRKSRDHVPHGPKKVKMNSLTDQVRKCSVLQDWKTMDEKEIVHQYTRCTTWSYKKLPYPKCPILDSSVVMLAITLLT